MSTKRGWGEAVQGEELCVPARGVGKAVSAAGSLCYGKGTQ
jgi:hypothetical protein